MKCLIVDDSTVLREMLSDILRDRGHEVVACADAETACALYKNEFYPLLLLDWNLPGMDGLEMCRWVREQPKGEHSVILMITGRSQQDGLHLILEAGADDYLAKPFQNELLNVRLTIAERKFHAIQKRKQAEEKVHKSKSALEQAHKQLQNNQMQLVQSEKMASLGQLAAGVAHEINNPIAFIKGNLEVLVDYVRIFKSLLEQYETCSKFWLNQDSPEVESHLRKIKEISEREDLPHILKDVDDLLQESRDGTDRVKDIVLGLKSFARVDEAELKEADLNEGLEATLKIVWNELKYKCKVIKKLGEIPPILCYPGQLNQVFMNLVVNASQAIPEQGTITIETYQSGKSAVVRVTDTGKGISKEHLPKLFDPFFTTKKEGEGTGLGLSVSHGIIQEHQGRIEVESEVGQGTTFTIHLPIKGGSHELQDRAVCG